MNAKKTEKGEEKLQKEKHQKKEETTEEEGSNEEYSERDREPRLHQTNDELKQEYQGKSLEKVKDRSRKRETLGRRGRPYPEEKGGNFRIPREFNPSRKGLSRQIVKYGGRRNTSRNPGNDLKKNIIRNKLMSTKSFQDNSISHNTNIDTPMPWMKVTDVPLEGIDGIRVTGTEYVTSLNIRTTGPGATVYTEQGDFIYSVPLHPKFFSGTRLLALARLYQKYKFQKIVFEIVPLVPSTQDGALIMFVQYDIEENISVISDPETKLREVMSHLGAKMFNVYTYGRCHLDNDNQLKMYDFETGNEPRMENQGTFNVVAASTFSSLNNEQEDKVLAQVLVHYEMDLFERGLSDDPTETITKSVAFSGTVTGTFTNFDPSVGPLVINKTQLISMLGFSPNISDIIIFRVTETLLHGAVAINTKVQGQTGNRGGHSVLFLFEKGSIWYIYPWVDAPDTYYGISDSLDTAMVREKDFILSALLPGTDLITCAGTMAVYNLEN